MGMTMTQKILAKHAGLDHVVPGQLVEARLDLVLGNDITAPVAITEFDKAGLTQVFDKDKIALVLDHSTPCKDIKSAQLCAPRPGNLPRNSTSPTSMTWAVWAWSTPCCPRRG